MIKPLSLAYNYCNTYEFYPYSMLASLCADTPYYSKEEFDEAVSHPIIIHFLGEERPWRKGCTHSFTNEYRRYLSMTPYRNAHEEPGWEVYFKLWRCFNIATKHLPKLRYSIINGLIPWFMKYRKAQRMK